MLVSQSLISNRDFFKRILTPTALCVIGFSLNLYSQYTVTSWRVEDGLPQSSVRNITQTKDGYLWVSTWNGIARFDGVSFTVFHSANTPALYSSNVQSLFCDRRGNLWIGVDGGGVVQYSNGLFTRYDSSKGIPAKRILNIYEDHSGRIWFSTELGFFVLDGKKVLHFSTKDGLPRNYCDQVISDPDGTLYLRIVDHIVRARLLQDSLQIENIFPINGRTVALDSAGFLWYGITNKGLMKREKDNEQLYLNLRGVHPNEIFLLRNGEKWLLTADDIRIISEEGVQVLKEMDGIALNGIGFVFEDREENIWLGKSGGGLLRLRKKQVQVFSSKNSSLSDDIMCGHEDRKGNLWIGTWNGGLFRRQSSSNRFEKVLFPFPNSPPILDIKESRNGRIWLSTWAIGVYTISGDRAIQIPQTEIVNHVSIASIAEDKNGGMWVGTSHYGVAYINGNEFREWSDSTGLSSNEINVVSAAKNGDVWVATSGGGVNRISAGNVTILNKENGLTDNFVNTIYEDSTGTVWIGTTRGLNRWKPDRPGIPGGTGTLTAITQEQGLHDDAINQCIEDGGYLWIGSIHGIYRVGKQELNEVADGEIQSVQSFVLGKEDGMINEECGAEGNSRAWKTRDGKLWFSTSAGAVSFDPQSVSTNTIPPNVIIEGVLVENKPASIANDVVVNPGETKIELRYTGISFSAPKKIRFKFKMEGFDERWIDAGMRRTAHYTNLDPGEYRFRIIASNFAGVWNEQGASLLITVLPPWWATWWFRGVIVILFIVTGPAIYFYRVTLLKKEQERQREFSRQLIQSQEQERKRIAAELHDSVGQDLLIIKNKLLIESENGDSTTARAGLKDVVDYITKSLKNVREISRNLRPVQLDQLGLTTALESVIETIAESSRIKFTTHLDNIDNMLTKENEINLFRIVQECLNNILKHSKATEVVVEIKKETDMLTVMIKDNGIGMDMNNNHNKGFGMSSMKERAHILGGELRIDSQPKSGTIIILIISFKSENNA